MSQRASPADAKLLREFACAVCGAPRSCGVDSTVIMCRHCGAFMGWDSDGQWSVADATHQAGVLQMLRPTAAQARLMALALEQAALGPDDRERFRTVTEEQTILMAVAHPNLVPPLPTDPSARARHVREQIALAEIVTFDATVRSRMQEYAAASGHLGSADDKVLAATKMLDAARRYWALLVDHPELPPGMLREGAEHHARHMVRAAVDGLVPLLGEGVAEQIRMHVLGDRELASEPSWRRCGGPLPPTDGLAVCTHCGAAARVDDADAWTTAQLGLFRITLGDLLRRGQLDGPTPVIAAFGGFLYTDAGNVSPERVVAFLRRAVPWLSRQDLHAGIDLLIQACPPERRALLAQVRAETETWVAEGQKPSRPEPPTLPAATPDEEQAWVQSNLALAAYQRPKSLIELLGYALSAIQVAATTEQPTGASPQAAMRFFEGAWPGYDREDMALALARLRPGYDTHPRVAAFTLELAALLDARPAESGASAKRSPER
jgi:hypothetical protein